MAQTTIKTKIKHNVDPSSSYVPLKGELVFLSDAGGGTVKFGDGTKTVANLTAIGAASVPWSGITSKPSYYDAKAIKSITRSGTTFTWTCMDGTTGTFTQQDNNTTYSAGTGLTLSGTTFSLNAAATKTALGLGSNAYTSTAYLPLTGGSMSGAIIGQPSAKNTFLLWGSSTDKNTTYDIPWYSLSFYNDGVQQGNVLGLVNYWGINFITSPNINLLHNGIIILNASNYTNYAPTKTGSGASGTWGISITGSASSVKDSGDGRTLTFNYSASGLSSTTWLAGWNGNELRAVSPSVITAGKAGFLTCEDTRATMATPNEYTMGADLEFKSAEATGLSGYSAVLTVKPWNDSSGGVVHQLAFNASGLYHRISNSNLTSWGSWCKLWQAGDAVTGAVWN